MGQPHELPYTMALSSRVSIGSGVFLLLQAFFILNIEGRVLVSEAGKELPTTAWLPYSTSISSYPQCCGNDPHCQMVRLSDELLKTLVDSPSALRLEFSGVDATENLQVLLAYDKELQAATSHGNIGTKLYFVAPSTLEERSKAPCLVAGQEASMNLFHKLILLGESSGPSPSLYVPLKGSPPLSCCEDSTVCTKISFEANLLSQRTSIVQIPLPWRLPQLFPDKLESFRLSSTIPASCVGLCDIYNYRGAPGLSARVINSRDGKHPSLSMTWNGVTYSADFCPSANGYVITAKAAEDLTLLAQLQESEISPEPQLQTRSLDGDAYDPIMGERTLISTPHCTYKDMFCDWDYGQIEVRNLNYTAQSDSNTYVDECRDACNSTASCKHFTVWRVWTQVNCYLLEDCKQTFVHACIKEETCISAPMNCTATTQVVGGCDPPASLTSDYIQWQCVDVDENVILPKSALNETVPVGTSCLLRCNAWEASDGKPGYLFSQCNSEGNWTATKALHGNANLTWPAGPYPLPTATETSDPAPLTCTCQDYDFQWPGTDEHYNPNAEVGAAFVCEGNPSVATGNITLNHTDTCFFLCDDYLVTEVSCTDGVWTSNLKTGLWCYNPIKCFLLDTYYAGPSLQSFASITSAEACVAKCDSRSDCNYWLHDPATNRCKIFKEVVTTSPNVGPTAGEKNSIRCAP